MNMLASHRLSGSLLHRLFRPLSFSPGVPVDRASLLADMPVPVTVREHLLSPEAMYKRVRNTTQPDFTWLRSLSQPYSTANALNLHLSDPLEAGDLEALQGLLSPGHPSSPLSRSHLGMTIEVRLASFELREAVSRFGASGVSYAMLDFEDFFREAFVSAVPEMKSKYPIGEPIAPLVITSYCGDRDTLRDPMGSVGVDFHLPGIGVLLGPHDAGKLVELSCVDLTSNCLRLEQMVRERFVGLLVEYDH